MNFLTFLIFFIASSFILEIISGTIVIFYKAYLIHKAKKQNLSQIEHIDQILESLEQIGEKKTWN